MAAIAPPTYDQFLKSHPLLAVWSKQPIGICFSYHYIGQPHSLKLKGHYTTLEYADQKEVYEMLTALIFSHLKDLRSSLDMEVKFLNQDKVINFTAMKGQLWQVQSKAKQK